MAISAELLAMMVCPACRENLELKSDGSGLKCLGCRRVYPIRDEIPVMIIEDAVME
ncbi:MAG: Trm112 family protein [Acidobacteriota bacterium]|nr:Trm112 family protein [Acidobacteriota bacterium]